MTVNILDVALNAAWAMEEAALRGLLDIAAREHQVTPEALEAYRAKSLEAADRATFRDGVAILDVRGPLFKRANLFTAMSGATSYDVLRRDLQAALDNSDVRAILLNIDSPGGEAAGTGELATAIFEARGKKPIVAYAGDLAASAGYWIASAADRIIVGEGAALGSIGVRAAYADTSARDQARGIKTVEFVSSQSPFKRADLKSGDGRARIQSRVDALAQVFVDTVARNRGVSVASVLDSFGKGDVLIGKAAVAAGMADSFGTFESVLATLSRDTDPLARFGLSATAAESGNSEEAMTDQEQAAAAAAEAEAAEAARVAAETAAAEEAARVAAEEEAARVAAEAAANDPVVVERARVKEIFDLSLPGYEQARDEAIQTGSSAHAFSAFILGEEKRKRDERAADVAADTAKNAEVKPSTGGEQAGGAEAFAQSILAARKLALGE